MIALDPNLEKVVLNCALMSADAARTITAVLTPHHFADGRNRLVWESVGRVLDAGKIPDAVTVGYDIAAEKLTSAFGTGSSPHFIYLAELQNCGANYGNAERLRFYLQDLDAASAPSRRKLVADALAAGDMDTRTGTDALKAIEAGIDLDGTGKSAADHLGDLTDRQEHAEQMAREGRKFSGLDTGFDAFNHRIDGIRPGELTVLAASPSIGKTTLALQIALNVMAKNDQAPVGYFSLEMTSLQVAERAVIMLSGANPFQLLRQGADVDGPAYREATNRYTKAKVNQWAPLPFSGYYDKKTLPEIQQTLSLEHRRRPRPLWVVDHLHHMDLTGLAQNRHEQLGIAAKEFSRISKDLNTHILLLAQLNRNFKNRTDYRPQLTDLREAGGIEEAADNAVLIYRPGFYPDLCRQYEGDPDQFASYAVLQFEKARHIGIGEEEVTWLPDQAMYANAAPVSLYQPSNGNGHALRHEY